MNAKCGADALCGRSSNSGLNWKSFPNTTFLTNLSGQLLLHFLIQILRKKKTGFSSNMMGVDDFQNFGDKKKSGPEFLTNSHSILLLVCRRRMCGECHISLDTCHSTLFCTAC